MGIGTPGQTYFMGDIQIKVGELFSACGSLIKTVEPCSPLGFEMRKRIYVTHYVLFSFKPINIWKRQEIVLRLNGLLEQSL